MKPYYYLLLVSSLVTANSLSLNFPVSVKRCQLSIVRSPFLQLRAGGDSKESDLSQEQILPIGMSNATIKTAVTVYATMAAGFSVLLAKTLWKHPLFPFQADSAAWSFSWLMTTVVDYYGAALCLCGIVVASEPPLKAALWTMGICCGGTPFCCMYVINRMLRRGSLRLS